MLSYEQETLWIHIKVIQHYFQQLPHLVIKVEVGLSEAVVQESSEVLGEEGLRSPDEHTHHHRISAVQRDSFL